MVISFIGWFLSTFNLVFLICNTVLNCMSMIGSPYIECIHNHYIFFLVSYLFGVRQLPDIEYK